MNIGYFISSHGFGHASRACAVIDKLSIIGDTNFFIFTTTPEWFFRNSLSCPFNYFEIQTDVGLIQSNPFIEDLDKTSKALEDFLPFSDTHYDEFLQFIMNKKLDFLICDISPFGIWVAEKIGIPSILVENFTWDWIYEHYQEQYPKLNDHISVLREIYQLPSMHFTCIPFCKKSKNSIIVSLVFRESRSSRKKIRKDLCLSDEDVLVLVTMGGIPIDHHDQNINFSAGNIKFVFPINNVKTKFENENIIYLPHNHPYFHPDLVKASDLVIGKLGYSTVSEVYSLSKPFLYIGRKNFREASILEKYVREEMVSNEIEVNNIFSSQTIEKIQYLISKTKEKNLPINGADQISNLIWKKFY